MDIWFPHDGSQQQFNALNLGHQCSSCHDSYPEGQAFKASTSGSKTGLSLPIPDLFTSTRSVATESPCFLAVQSGTKNLDLQEGKQRGPARQDTALLIKAVRWSLGLRTLDKVITEGTLSGCLVAESQQFCSLPSFSNKRRPRGPAWPH